MGSSGLRWGAGFEGSGFEGVVGIGASLGELVDCCRIAA